MKWKKCLLAVLIICMFLCVGAVSAGENVTSELSDSGYCDNITQVQESDYADEPLAQAQDDDVLSTSKTVYFDASATKDGDGSSSNPYKNFQASRLKSVSTAYFAKGTYTISSTTEIDNFLTYTTTIIGEGSENTIFKASTSSYSFKIKEKSTLILKGITFTNVKFSNYGTLDISDSVFCDYKKAYRVVYAPAIKSGLSTINLANCNFSGYTGNTHGGVIYSEGSAINIDKCTFSDSSSTKYGGTVYAAGSTLSVLNSRFANSESKYGGAIYVENSGISVVNSCFESCMAYSFGGVLAADTSNMTVNRCNFTNFRSEEDSGGAIYSVDGALNLYSSMFVNGSAVFGGAVANLKTNFAGVANVFGYVNALYSGGAIYNVFCSEVYILNNYFFKATANSSNGAIFNRISDTLNITGNVFESCNAQTGFVMGIDGDEDTMTIRDNAYRSLYSLVGYYSGYLNGQQVSHVSNFITFSFSNDGQFIPVQEYDGMGSSAPSNFVDFKIYVENREDKSVVYCLFGEAIPINFNLIKKDANLESDFMRLYLIDESGNQMLIASADLTSTTDFYNATFINLIFDEKLMTDYHSGSYYYLTSQSSVPVINYDPVQTNIPSSYDSRNYGYITPVKDQGQGGNCWSFAALATLEACIKKATGITYDFSEENLKNLMAEYSLVGRNWDPNGGGRMDMVVGYLASWVGPVADERDVYDEFSALSPIFDCIFHVQNVYVIPERKNSYDNALVKQAIMDYGAVAISVPWLGGNHAITLIGWDDNYRSYDVFNNYAQGAWIFKNSYGTSWKDKGFSYLSYDAPIYEMYTFLLDDTRGYSEIYQYDFSGLSNYVTYGISSMSYKNNFVSRNNDVLSAVSTYFKDPTQYEVKIHLNGVLVSTQSGYSQAGYYTIPLETEVQLAEGDNFSVSIKLSGNSKCSIPVYTFSDVHMSRYGSAQTYSEGMSFINYYADNWIDLYTDGGRCNVACIKAFTRPATQKEVEITMNQFDELEINREYTINVNVPESYASGGYLMFLNGLVEFTINDKMYYADVENGMASLNIKFDSTGSYTFRAQYKSNLEVSNAITFNFEVKDKVERKILITADPVEKYYSGPENYVANVRDGGFAVPNEDVKISVDGNSYTVKTDSNGVATLNLNLNPGTYEVCCECEGFKCYSQFIVKPTVSIVDSIGEYKNATVSATFLNSAGNFLNSGQATFTVDGKQYTATINASGSAVVNVDLAVGNYMVTVTNPVTGEESQAELVVNKINPVFNVTHYQIAKNVIFEFAFDDPAAQGICYVSIEGNVFHGDVENGKATVEVSNLKDKTYEFLAYYSGDDNYNTYSVSGSLTVMKFEVTLSAEDMSFYYGSSANRYKVTVKENDNPVSNRPVSFTINGKTETAYTNSAGEASVAINEPAGTYQIVADYGGEKITSVIEVKTTIIVPSDSCDYANAEISVQVLDSNGDFIGANRNVIAKANNKQFENKTVSFGNARISIDLDVGTHAVTVINPVTAEEKTFPFTVLKSNPVVEYAVVDNYDYYDYVVKFLGNKATGTVTFQINEKEYVTNINGNSATLSIRFAQSADYTVAIKYSGDGNLYSFTDSRVEYFKGTLDTIEAASAVTANYGTDYYLSVRLLDFSGKAKANSQITVVVGKSSQVLNTDSNGYAKLLVNYNAGSYSAVFSNNGGASKTVKITVKKSTPKLTAAKATFKVKANKKYKATLTLGKRKLAKMKVSIKVGGKTYSANTDSKGKVTLNLSKLKKKGKFSATVSFAGNGNLNKVSKKVQIIVK